MHLHSSTWVATISVYGLKEDGAEKYDYESNVSVYKPCVGTLGFWFGCRIPLAAIPLLFIGDVIPVPFTVFGMFAVDFVSNLVVVTPLLVLGGRCVVVIFVNVYGGKSFIISESIMRAICWKLDEFCTLLHEKRRGTETGETGSEVRTQKYYRRIRMCCFARSLR